MFRFERGTFTRKDNPRNLPKSFPVTFVHVPEIDDPIGFITDTDGYAFGFVIDASDDRGFRSLSYCTPFYGDPTRRRIAEDILAAL